MLRFRGHGFPLSGGIGCAERLMVEGKCAITSVDIRFRLWYNNAKGPRIMSA